MNNSGMTKSQIKEMFQGWIDSEKERLVPGTVSYNRMAHLGIDDMDYVIEWDLDEELAYTPEINEAILSRLKELGYVDQSAK